MPPHPLKVFLCHATMDKPAVRELYRYLKERKMDPWLDEKKLLGGQTWREEIPKAIFSSDAIIVCLSKNSIDKEGYIQTEIKSALDKAKEIPSGRIFVIPAKLEECGVPNELKDYQWVNLFEEDGYRRLMKSLRARAEEVGATKVSSMEQDKPLQSDSLLSNVQKQGSGLQGDSSIDVGGGLSSSNIIVGNNNVIQVIPKSEPVGQVPNLTDMPNEKAGRTASRTYEGTPIPKPEPKNQRSVKFPTWGIGLIVFACLGLAVWGISSLPTSPKATQTPPATQTFFIEPAIETPIPTTETPVPVTNTPTTIPTSNLRIGSTMIGEDGATLVYVPAGEFSMGSENGDANEKPVHTVYLDAFWIDQTVVTNNQYAACVAVGKCDAPFRTSSYTHDSYYGNSEFDNFPVIYVNWDDAKTYCEWAGRRLPTEAEWEKAARGTDGRTYPWGEDISCDKANYYDGSKYCVGDTSAVRSYESSKSPYGAYDMAGNIWEWVNDWYGSTYYKSLPSFSNPLGPDMGQYRVLRGGSWNYFDNGVRSAIRNWYSPTITYVYVGFRCARSP